jgi:hypothetical protein
VERDHTEPVAISPKRDRAIERTEFTIARSSAKDVARIDVIARWIDQTIHRHVVGHNIA